MIVLDASVLIAYLDAEDAQHHTAESLLAREIDDQFAANPLTLAEVLCRPCQKRSLDEARQTSPSLWGSMLAEGSTPSSASSWTGPSPGSEPEPAAVFREDRSGSVTSVVVGA